MRPCKHWLCRLVGHKPMQHTIGLRPSVIAFGGLPTVWWCHRSWRLLPEPSKPEQGPA